MRLDGAFGVSGRLPGAIPMGAQVGYLPGSFLGLAVEQHRVSLGFGRTYELVV